MPGDGLSQREQLGLRRDDGRLPLKKRSASVSPLFDLNGAIRVTEVC